MFLFLQKIKSIESISNSNCKNETLSLVGKKDISDTFDSYLQNAQSSGKLSAVSVSPASIFFKDKLHLIVIELY